MKKLMYFAVAVAVMIPAAGALAEFNEVSLTPGIAKFNLSALGLNYVIGSGTRGIQSAKADTGSMQFGLTANSILVLTSADKSKFTVTGSSCDVDTVCSSDKSTLTISCGNGASANTATITPGAASTCTSGGSGNSGGSGGSSGGGGSSTPAVPAKPAVPTVSPAVPATPAVPPLRPGQKQPGPSEGSEVNVPTPPAAAAAHKFAKSLKKGASGKEVQELQERLKELGFFPVNFQPTKTFGAGTEKALKAYQKENGLPPNGQLTADTRAMLNGESVETAPAPTVSVPSASAPGEFVSQLKRGSKGDEVLALQQKLEDLGYLKATPNGIFGPATEKAVKAFQKANKLSQVGFVGPGTRAALNSQ